MKRIGIAALAASVILLAGCAGVPGAGDGAASPAVSSAPKLSGTITVLAAASLTDTFQTLAHDFEKQHPGVTVTFSFGGSSALAQQLVAGSPADVFAAASTSTMKIVTDAGVASNPTNFATNTLELAVPPGNPAKVTGLVDLANPALKIALCAPEVPCGAATVAVFKKAGITAVPDTLEQDVKSVLTKIELGEVDAGLVYRTDVLAAGKGVEGIDFPEAASVVNEYPIAVVSATRNADVAAAFVAFVISKTGRAALSSAGFGAP